MSTHWGRRKNKNRRKMNSRQKHPFKDRQGRLVTCDRRSQDERRAGIDVIQEIISMEEFEALLLDRKMNKNL